MRGVVALHRVLVQVAFLGDTERSDDVAVLVVDVVAVLSRDLEPMPQDEQDVGEDVPGEVVLPLQLLHLLRRAVADGRVLLLLARHKK